MNATQDDRPDKAAAAAGGPEEQAATPTRAELPEDALIILPVRNMVLFPGLVAPVTVGRSTSIAAAQEAVRSERQIGVLLQRDLAADAPTPAQLYRMGTTANILRYITGPDGAHHVVCQGQQRFRIIEFLTGYPFYAARIERIAEPEVHNPDIEARMVQVKTRATDILELLPKVPADLIAAVEGMSSPTQLADFVAGLMDMSPQEKQEILEVLPIGQRLDKVLDFLVHRVEILRLSQEIDQQTKSRLDEKQRQYLLREQMKTIREQLGENEEDEAGLDELGSAIAKARLPDEVERHARKELRRLGRMSESAAEYSMLRTYLEWIAELPWSETTEDRIDINEARRILDEDHCGLDKIKRRILEHLAVKKLNPAGKSPILCFVGPPGVGKTSLGQSIARATGRKFARVSLGGVHDEAEIRGHRRTYIGALPGNIIQAVKKAGSRNCVMMLDEMDKLGSGIQGDPSAALLEVLDPAQNATFRDNYLGLPFDLSQVMFIATANMLDTIPTPLRDRMEVIQLPGYTAAEKVQIARRYLVPRQLEANGLSAEQCELDDDALRAIVRDYTREAGVRNLEREIGRVLRYVAMKFAEGSTEPTHVGPEDLAAILGPARFESEVALRTSMPGVATGLAWTPVGGDILFIEASLTPGTGKLVLTGQLGDVMKESAQAALTLVKGYATQFKLAPNTFEKHDLHVHVPAGAIPKDGPSAGVAMFVALASLAQNRPVRADVAMTGEISLRGLVLPVGGIKLKVLAALQAGIGTVLLPARNRKDLDEIPQEARERLTFQWLDNVDDALREALVPLPEEKAAEHKAAGEGAAEERGAEEGEAAKSRRAVG